ncbi:type II toxin-antitoxin system HicA family toxin [Selenomonas dianae]|uniref:Type II toxin-antitoxin system HicA family toxin n=1 Tax=Selenomonas dianae TaxID=135079 RepID=A0ABN0T0M1_9FIRM|nr:type II toxin-antitoxin system HicA family toxin [Selenomonas dianae]WLD82200.1 type II toxin-antitoxin system HicA family toxin [Selenomonas dianae]
MLKADGWYEVHCVGDHHQFKHPTKKGRVTVPHPVKDVTQFVLKRISEQSGIVFS